MPKIPDKQSPLSADEEFKIIAIWVWGLPLCIWIGIHALMYFMGWTY